MRLALVSARGLTGEQLRFALVEHDVRPTDGLVCPVDDRLHAEAVGLCRAHAWPLEVVDSVITGHGLELILREAVVLVITDGNDYVCAEVERRATALGRRVLVRTMPWEQVRIDVD